MPRADVGEAAGSVLARTSTGRLPAMGSGAWAARAGLLARPEMLISRHPQCATVSRDSRGRIVGRHECCDGGGADPSRLCCEVTMIFISAPAHCPYESGGLKGSTQHFILDGRDGVDGDGARISFEVSMRRRRRSCGIAGSVGSC